MTSPMRALKISRSDIQFYRAAMSPRWMLLYTRKVLCNFQVAFVLGMCVGVQIFISLSSPQASDVTYGDEIYYWKNKLRIPFSTYSKAVVYKLVILPTTEERRVCDGSSFALQKVGGLPVKNASLFQTLGSTNVHVISGFVDDRIVGRKFIRILAVGLYPGPGEKISCNFDCTDSSAKFCSTSAYSVVVLAGTGEGYDDDLDKRKSLMDVLSITCPISNQDSPKHVTLTHEKCGFSHSQLPLSVMTFQDVVPPMWDLGVCVKPFSSVRFPGITSTRHVALWIEYLRLLGIDGIHFYTGALPNGFDKLLKFYEKETFRILFSKQWEIIENRTESVVSDEAAINDCIYSQMMKYRTVVVTSFDQWPSFGSRYYNMKQLVRDKTFDDLLGDIGGVKITSSDGSEDGLIIRPKQILHTAANYYIPLTGKYDFRRISMDQVRLLHYSQRQKCYPYVVAEEQLEALVTKKLDSIER